MNYKQIMWYETKEEFGPVATLNLSWEEFAEKFNVESEDTPGNHPTALIQTSKGDVFAFEEEYYDFPRPQIVVDAPVSERCGKWKEIANVLSLSVEDFSMVVDENGDWINPVTGEKIEEK